MKKQLVLGLLGACVLSGNAQTFKEWQDPEINAINRAPMHANFFAYENVRNGCQGSQGRLQELYEPERNLEILLGTECGCTPHRFLENRLQR